MPARRRGRSRPRLRHRHQPAPRGLYVDIAGDGASALARVGVNGDLVCLDLNLPDTDGLEVCRQVVSMPTSDDAAGPRIIMLCAGAASATASAASMRGPTTTW